tara:strand:+ start:183 stop:746 length:564 start_codon:yes stop_codon:yes gene_type:complete
MKSFYLTLLLIFFSIPCSILGETMSDLIWNNGLYYKKDSKIPFDGIITGEINGSFSNGKKHGKWTRFYNNGGLFSISNYNLGLKNGDWITFSKNGQYIEKGRYKNNLEDGTWLRFFENGTINYIGNFMNGKKTGFWQGYYYNGQLEYKGSFKNGKKDGFWVYYSSNGTKSDEFSGIYEDGNKISKAL